MNKHTNGVIVGKFLPMHNGHIFIIKEAKKMVDKLFVIVDEHPTKDRKICNINNFPYMDLNTRYNIVKENLKDLENIEVLMLSEEGLPEYPDGWLEWSKEVIKVLGLTPNYIFTSDEIYIKSFEKYFTKTIPVLIDPKRNNFTISSTIIRNNWYNNQRLLPHNVVEFIKTKK